MHVYIKCVVSKCIHMYSFIFASTYEFSPSTCVYVSIHIHIQRYPVEQIFAHILKSISFIFLLFEDYHNVHIYIYTYIYIHTNIYIHTYIYIYTYIYIHTYIMNGRRPIAADDPNVSIIDEIPSLQMTDSNLRENWWRHSHKPYLSRRKQALLLFHSLHQDGRPRLMMQVTLTTHTARIH